jgi:eukaryotic-like serine/threonine-protein kinase
VIGQEISHYKILEKLGEGGMGVVYKAHDTKLDRTVALKFLPLNMSVTDKDKERFIREAKAVAALNHPHICTIYSVEEYDGQQFISMEYVDGVTLREKMRLSSVTRDLQLRRGEPRRGLSMINAITFSIQIAEALRQAHNKDIVHRDIKPENIMVTEDNRIKVMDFGLAKLKGAENLTKSGGTVGTLAYMSPEQIQGGDVDQRSDIFSLGVVLYEMLTGQKPFRGEHEAAMVYSIVNEAPQPVQTYLPDASSKLDHIINRVLEKDPGERYLHINELIVDLKKIKEEIISDNASQKQSMSVSGKSVPQNNNSMKANSLLKPALWVTSLAFMLIIAIFYFTAEKRPEADGQQSIAVLPFENLSSDPDDAYFADGVHEDIIIHLSRISDIRVIARSSVLQFQPGDRNIRSIAADLNTTAVLEGNIRRAGDVVRVSVQLIDPQTNQTLWADIYDRDLTDMFVIQSEIARNIAAALEVRMTAEEERAIDRIHTENLDAYRLYVRGRERLAQRTERGMREAVSYFRESIDHDEEYTLAYVGLADALFLLHDYGFERHENVLPQAEDAVRSALELDPRSAEAHASLGLMHGTRREGPAAVRELQRAIELRPNYAEAHNLLSWFSLVLDDREQALESAKHAVELDPLSAEAVSNLSLSYLVNGNEEAAIREARIARDIQPEFTTTNLYEGAALYHIERYADAIAVLRNISAAWAGEGPRSILALAYIAEGNDTRAREILSEIKEIGDSFAVGLIYAAFGDIEEAMEYFEKINSWEYWPILTVRYLFPDILNILRNDERYRRFIHEINRQWNLTADKPS